MAAIGPVTGPSSGGMRWIFRPTSARWACRKGWPGPSRRHCPRRTATPTPCAGSCGQSWRSMRACRRSRSSAAMGRQTSSSGWSGPESPAGRWSPHPPLRSMPLRWKVSAARWNASFAGAGELCGHECVLCGHPSGVDMVFLCQPNNPTGQLTALPLVEQILHRCAALRHPAGGGRMLP